MGTFLVDDNFPDHVKFAELLDEHVGLWVKALAWINRQETDGFIPAAMLRRLSSSKKPEKLVEKLIQAGLWVACDGGWMVHDYLEWNASKEHREARRQAARARMAGARAQKHVPSSPPSERTGSPDVRANTSGTRGEVPAQFARSFSTSGSGSGSGSGSDAADAAGAPAAVAQRAVGHGLEARLEELLRDHRALADSGLDVAELAKTLAFAGDARHPQHVLAAVRRGLDAAAPQHLTDARLVTLLQGYAKRASERDVGASVDRPTSSAAPPDTGPRYPVAPPPPTPDELAEYAAARAAAGAKALEAIRRAGGGLPPAPTKAPADG